MPGTGFRFVAAGLIALAIASLPAGATRADDATPAAPAAAQPIPSAPAASTPSQPLPAPSSAAPSAPSAAPSAPATSSAPAAAPAAPPPAAAQPLQTTPDAAKPEDASKPKAENSTGETVDLPQRPFAFVEGKADRDEVFGAIQASLATVKRELDAAGLKTAGRPLAVFIESDDTGFRYHAGYPLDSAPDAKATPPDPVKIGAAPSGKAMRFQHLGAYSDIDGTYDAITAYLDEKGIDAQDSFIEEYANDIKDVDDPNLEVDIYVLLK
jgi:effector-binding domain-containing protein